MAIFWLWGVRNLFLALAAVVAFAGYRGVADPSVVLSTMLGLALVAEAGSRFGRRALKRQRRMKAALAAIRSANDLRERYRSHEQRRAA